MKMELSNLPSDFAIKINISLRNSIILFFVTIKIRRVMCFYHSIHLEGRK